MPDILFDKRPDGVALITFNRPEKLNATGPELLSLLAQALDDCDRDAEVRCVALTGAGRAFCAGGDVDAMRGRLEGVGAPGGPSAGAVLDGWVADLRRSQELTSLRLHRLSKPTVALVNGYAIGAGLSLALACDLRVCSEAARFGTGFRNVALSGDYGGSYYLQRLVGPGRARELYLTAEVIDADRALALGIANRVLPAAGFLEAGLDFCANLAAGPTAAFARMKENLSFAETAPLVEVLAREALNQCLLRLTADHKEATTAFREKRPPLFRGA
jgi:2-(1,2-epoxy-1,2-dihydrophenyl)acetyl-CoA isomerase